MVPSCFYYRDCGFSPADTSIVGPAVFSSNSGWRLSFFSFNLLRYMIKIMIRISIRIKDFDDL